MCDSKHTCFFYRLREFFRKYAAHWEHQSDSIKFVPIVANYCRCTDRIDDSRSIMFFTLCTHTKGRGQPLCEPATRRLFESHLSQIYDFRYCRQQRKNNRSRQYCVRWHHSSVHQKLDVFYDTDERFPRNSCQNMLLFRKFCVTE